MKKLISKKLIAFIVISIGMFSTAITNAQWVNKASGFTTPNRAINEMIAVNANVAWALTYDGNAAFVNPDPDFTRTIDGGKTWIPGTIGMSDQYLVGLAPISADVAFILSSDINFVGKVLKTTNGGVTWTEQHPFAGKVFYDNIYFFNPNDGVIIGNPTNGFMTIYTTSDGGNNWLRVPKTNMPKAENKEYPYIFSVAASGNNFWTVSTHGRVWKTIDKGLHWDAYPTQETLIDYSNLKMRDAMNGLWGVHDELYRTADGGITWTEITPIGTWFTNDISYVHGTASTWISTGGDVHSLYGSLHGLGSSYSIDDGNTWITLDTAVDHLAIDMVSNNKGFCGGFNVNSTTNGVSVFKGAPLQRISNESTSNETISIFPNPVSNSTAISFSLSQSQNASLKIFDLSGRLVKTLVDGTFPEGKHQIEWNAADVNAGVYFLQFQSSENFQTEKLIVTK